MNKRPFFLVLSLFLVLPAHGQEEKKEKDRETIRTVYDTVRKSFVGIDLVLRKKTRLEKVELEDESLDAEAQRLYQASENEQPVEAWGFAVAPDLILMADKTIKESDLQKIRVTDSRGETFEAKFFAVGRNHDFVLLKPVEPRALVPLEFSDWQAPALGEGFHVSTAERVDEAWQLNVSPYVLTNAPLVDAKGWFCMDAMRPGALVSDKKGATVGIALDAYLWTLADGRSSFLGKGILADDRLSDLEQRYEPLRKSLPASVKRIEITFRAEKQTERYMPSDEAHAGKTAVFGVAIDDRGTLFVPQDLTRDLVRKIEDIQVVEDGKNVPAAFVGLFRNFGGMIVRAEGLKTQPAIARDGHAPPPGQLFYSATFEDRFGRSRIRLDYNRVFRIERGLAGVARLQPRKRIKPGSFLLDVDGRIIGCATSDKKEEDVDELAAESTRDRYFSGRARAGYTPDHLRRLIFFSEIADLLERPAGAFDPRAVPMSKKDEKKLVWLGVEFQELSKPLAESLNVQERDFTNDGRRGLIVTELYAASPAARAGIQVGDILLSVQPDGENARDLVAEVDRFGFNRSMFSERRGNAAPPWKPVKNYLTTLLTEIGATKKVTFELLRGREKSKVALPLEYAPVDFETAERYKDDALGLTAKELTYDVRHFQRLDPGLSGVVVAKVESGSKSDVAKLPPLSIIVRVNDVAVKDLAQFRELAAASKSLTLTTVLLGQTKLVELSRD